MGLEGMVSKRKDRPYRAGRSKDWVKMKNRCLAFHVSARASRRGNSLADHFFIFKAAPSKVVTMACISPSLVM
jgi:ATP-dependent DNA ligase